MIQANQIQKKLISLPLLLYILLLWCCCIAVANKAAAHSAAIEITGEHRYNALILAPSIYNAANADLSDLRVLDSHGENVPFFINNSEKKTSREQVTYALTLANSYVKDSCFYFDYTLTSTTESDTIATSLKFTTNNNNFAKILNVYGSYDNKNWTFVQSDKIYAIDNAVKLYINFAHPQKYTHYRLRLANNFEQIAFSTVKLVYDVETAGESYLVEKLSPQFTMEEHDKTTLIVIYGLKNLRLCDIIIRTDNLFKRTASAQGGMTKELYNLSLNGIYLADLCIPLNRKIALGDTYIITIANGDDKPISIDAITVRYYSDELVFEGKTGEIYWLEFGADVTKKAPIYDIASYKNEILKGKLNHVRIGEIIYTTKTAMPEKDYKVIFNIVVVTVALVLGTVILLRLKRR